MKAPKKERDSAGTTAFEVALQHIMVRQDRSYHFVQFFIAMISLVFVVEVCFIFLFSLLLPLLEIKPEGVLIRLVEYTSPTIGILSVLSLLLLHTGKRWYAIEPGDQLMRRLNDVILEPCLGIHFDYETGKLRADEIWDAHVDLVTQTDDNSQA